MSSMIAFRRRVIGQQTCCALILGDAWCCLVMGAEETIPSPLAERPPCIFFLSCEVTHTSEGPTNLLQIQTIITGVRPLLKEDERKEDKLRMHRRAERRKAIAAPE